MSVISIFFNSCSPLFVTLIVYVIFLFAYTNLSSPTPVVAVFSTVKSGVSGIILSATAEFTAITLAGVHQSQKSFDTSFSSSSTLVTVVSPTSFTLVPVVTSVLFVALLFTLPLLAVTLFVTLLLGVVVLFCASEFGSVVVLSGVALFSPVWLLFSAWIFSFCLFSLLTLLSSFF